MQGITNRFAQPTFIDDSQSAIVMRCLRSAASHERQHAQALRNRRKTGANRHQRRRLNHMSVVCAMCSARARDLALEVC